MPTQSATRGLIWKETRQILPLMAIVVIVGVIASLLGQAAESFSPGASEFSLAILWVIPSCYAVGAGALLVGQEKEQKTATWLASLPSQPGHIAVTKLIIGLAGLLGMWLIAGLLLLLLTPPTTSTSIQYGPEIFLQSFLILACGFYAAWKMDNIFSGLVVLVPLACGPFLLLQVFYAIHHWTTGARYVSSEVATGVLFAFSVALTVVFTWLSIRAARQFFSPRPSQSPDRLTADRLLDAWRPAVTTTPDQPMRWPFSALIWQFDRHQRWPLLLVLGVLLIGGYGISWSGRTIEDRFVQSNVQTAGLFAGAIAALAVSWLGVMAFAGDGSALRVRFLADRGVSPGRVWAGRQLVPISLLSIAALGYFLFCWWALRHSRENNHVISLALVVIGAWAIYSVSQWISQSLPLLAGSVVVAPIVSIVALAWGGYSLTMLGAPIWWLLLCTLIPLAATWWMMRPFMDGSRDWKTILSIALVVLLAIVLPIVPCVIAITTAPDISDRQKQQMLAEASQIKPVATHQRLVRNRADGDLLFATSEEMLSLYQQTQFTPLDRFGLSLNESDHMGPLHIGHYLESNLLNAAIHARVLFENKKEDQATVDRLVDWINTITDWTVRLRLSLRLFDQIAADRMEIWLTDTLNDPAIANLANVHRSSAAKLLGDSDARNLARREAVLVSWRRSLEDRIHRNRPTLGEAYTPYKQDFKSTAAWMYTYQNSINLVAATLIDLIDAGSRGESTTEPRRRLRQLIEGVDWDSDQSPYSDHYRENVSLTRLHSDTDRYVSVQLGALWYARWEREAEKLAQVLRNQSKTDVQEQP